MSWRAHWWTVWPLIARSVRGPRLRRPAVPWTSVVEDPRWGPIRLHGALRRPPGARRCIVLVHGLGGSPRSGYLRAAEKAAEDLGVATLRVGLRGTEGEGEDLYHAGLSADLLHVLRAPELESFDELFLLGFSLGGHVALKAATEVNGERLGRVAAVCSPLDLAACVDIFDHPTRWPYRLWVFRGLHQTYTEVARRRDLAHSVERVTRIRRLREWDRMTVVPRFGFEDEDHYYETQSVGPRLDRLGVPGLLIAAEGDPMVDRQGIEPWQDASESLKVLWIERGGHVGFPPAAELGLGGRPGVERQVVRWLVSGEEVDSSTHSTRSPTPISASSRATP